MLVLELGAHGGGLAEFGGSEADRDCGCRCFDRNVVMLKVVERLNVVEVAGGR